MRDFKPKQRARFLAELDRERNMYNAEKRLADIMPQDPLELIKNCVLQRGTTIVDQVEQSNKCAVLYTGSAACAAMKKPHIILVKMQTR
jgi:hypothetical protein